MNCRRIEEMIPLYVGGDLERDRAELVSAHLRSCPECRDVAGQYTESQEWLRSYGPPPFGSAFFDDLKSAVLGQIERQESRPTFFQALAARWRWNAVFAAVALLVIVGGLAFYAYRRGLVGRPGDNRIVLVPQQVEPNAPPQERVVPPPERKQQADAARRRHRRATLKEKIAVLVPPIQPESDSEPSTVSQREEPAESEAPTSLEENPRTEENQMTREATTRIEIQTSDPNIRIIWFVPNNFMKLSDRRATDT